MAAIYIVSETGKISKQSEHLVFAPAKGDEQTLFVHNMEMLVAMGRISFTGDALFLLAKNKIPVIFASRNGMFNSRICYKESKNVFLRLKQYQIMQDEKISLEIAKSIVQGKIKNQISFMQRIKRKNQIDDEKVVDAIVRAKRFLKDAEECPSKESLRGVEGSASRCYFEVFRCNIIPEWAEFESRTKRPPKSNVNAALSFLYSLLSFRVETAVESFSLDCGIGNLHEPSYGKSPLVYDLMEEFRIPFADTVCCSLFNLGILCNDDFESRSDENGQNGIFLLESGMKKTIEAFEQKMNSHLQYDKKDDKITALEIIFYQTQSYRKFVENEAQNYEPYYFK